MWPLKFAHVLLSMTYFSTGVSKIIAARGLMWMNGYTLQRYTFGDACTADSPSASGWVSSIIWPSLLSVFTICFELFYFVSLFFRGWAPYFFLNAILFHIGLYYAAAGHDFFQHIVLNFICWFASLAGGGGTPDRYLPIARTRRRTSR